MAEVVIYSKSFCPHCTRAKALLESKGVSYEEIDVESDPNLQAEMVQETGGRKTVPQIFIDGLHIGGLEELVGVNAPGKLDELLNRGGEEA